MTVSKKQRILSFFGEMFVRLFIFILPRPFCPYCGANLISFKPLFYLVLPYYLHLLKCAKPHGITVKFGTFYDCSLRRMVQNV